MNKKTLEIEMSQQQKQKISTVLAQWSTWEKQQLRLTTKHKVDKGYRRQ